MPKYKKGQTVSSETQVEAQKIARGIQKPGQTKEQTKLIAQGIQKGIEQYKKQQKTKLREFDKQHKKITKQQSATPTTPAPKGQRQAKITTTYKQHWLPWMLLILTWIGIGIYFTVL